MNPDLAELERANVEAAYREAKETWAIPPETWAEFFHGGGYGFCSHCRPEGAMDPTMGIPCRICGKFRA